jgi:hypothetical protein
MAKPWTWVGLDTNAAAGRNGTKTAEEGIDFVETYVTHDSMAAIVTRHRQEANCLRGALSFELCASIFVLRFFGFHSHRALARCEFEHLNAEPF